MSVISSKTDIGELVQRVQYKYGIDLSKYRPSCLGRRVSIRMAAVGCHEFGEYLMYLDAHPGEAKHLLEVVTIHITEFLRDREVFEALQKRIFPEIIGGKLISGRKTIRIWSAGCSSGEEPYSIAILLLDLLQTEKINLNVEVFGTDISEESCAEAGRGVYPARKIKGIPKHLKERYFNLEDGRYHVSRDVRKHVRFKVHDIFTRPPVTMFDLVVCRNVLIHFDHAARFGVLLNFHSSLNDGGMLILGKSEALTGHALRLFELVDVKNKVYRKRFPAHMQMEE